MSSEKTEEHCLMVTVGMESKQQDFGRMVERYLETLREITGSMDSV